MKHDAKVCMGKSCRNFGGKSVIHTLEQAEINQEPIDADTCSCLGFCSYAPTVLVDDERIILEAHHHTIVEDIKNPNKGMPYRGREIDLDALLDF